MSLHFSNALNHRSSTLTINCDLEKLEWYGFLQEDHGSLYGPGRLVRSDTPALSKIAGRGGNS